ncbi:MAG: hypothetical protein CMJ18_05080 [Phycisphaeraceae bacterium]|nr:hypothetical protein [Phycisphaeraceae bacterium]
MLDGSNGSILIIDNDEGMTRAVATRLEHLGYRCTTAATGAQGLAAFSAQPHDLVITDLNMPQLDGPGLIERIRRDSDVPVIVMTGFRGSYIAGLSTLRGVSVLDKPFEAQSLIDLVECELAASRAATESDDTPDPLELQFQGGVRIDEIPN